MLRATTSRSLLPLSFTTAGTAATTATPALAVAPLAATRAFGAKSALVHPVTVDIIGAPFSGGQPITGVENGPDAIRQAGLIEGISHLDLNIVDKGNLDIPGIRSEDDDPIYAVEGAIGAKRPRAVGEASRIVAEATYESAAAGHFPVMLGGDHSLALGSIAGVLRARPETSVVWVDAHADINTPTSSPSGNMHGMPVAFLMALAGKDVPGFEWLGDLQMRRSRFVFVGLRDVDLSERQILRDSGIRAFSMHDVDKFGIGNVMELACLHVNPYNDRPIHLSFDIDSIEPETAPSTGTRKLGGLTYREACYVAEELHKTNCLASMDLVEVNPSIGTADDVTLTASVAKEVVACALGETVL